MADNGKWSMTGASGRTTVRRAHRTALVAQPTESWHSTSSSGANRWGQNSIKPKKFKKLDLAASNRIVLADDRLETGASRLGSYAGLLSAMAWTAPAPTAPPRTRPAAAPHPALRAQSTSCADNGQSGQGAPTASGLIKQNTQQISGADLMILAATARWSRWAFKTFGFGGWPRGHLAAEETLRGKKPGG